MNIPEFIDMKNFIKVEVVEDDEDQMDEENQAIKTSSMLEDDLSFNDLKKVKEEEVVVFVSPSIVLKEELHNAQSTESDSNTNDQEDSHSNSLGYSENPVKRAFQCNLCSHKSITKSNLNKHLRTHSTEKPFGCDKCSYRANHMYYLRKHILRHGEERPFACDLCQFKCKHSSTLRKHLSIHSTEKPFFCDQCPYRAKRIEGLKRHLTIHTEHKPFSCHLCTFRGKHKANLTLHLKKHSN